MSERYGCTADADPTERESGLDAAVSAIHRGDLVVLPTDTVYGIAADAFEPDAVAKLLQAKGRGRSMPPPVLVGSPGALDGVAAEVPDSGRQLVEQLWPGGLTIICREQPSLLWDLGETHGTVAVRMPDHELALDLLGRTGPLAVSSANSSGASAAENADEAQVQLDEAVAVYLDGGPTQGPTPSTIVDLTSTPPRVLRAGVIGIDRLRAVVPGILDVGESPESAGDADTSSQAPTDEVGSAPVDEAEASGDDGVVRRGSARTGQTGETDPATGEGEADEPHDSVGARSAEDAGSPVDAGPAGGTGDDGAAVTTPVAPDQYGSRADGDTDSAEADDGGEHRAGHNGHAKT